MKAIMLTATLAVAMSMSMTQVVADEQVGANLEGQIYGSASGVRPTVSGGLYGGGSMSTGSTNAGVGVGMGVDAKACRGEISTIQEMAVNATASRTPYGQASSAGAALAGNVSEVGAGLRMQHDGIAGAQASTASRRNGTDAGASIYQAGSANTPFGYASLGGGGSGVATAISTPRYKSADAGMATSSDVVVVGPGSASQTALGTVFANSH